MRILVMDDDRMVRDVMKRMLVTLGHEVETARNGEDALLLHRARKDSGKGFDIVIADLTVHEGMSGVETLRKVKTVDPTIKAVICSGYSNDLLLANYRKNGFDAILKKPFTMEQLSLTLHTLL